MDDNWRASALCAQSDAEVWFPRKGQSSATARRICMACTVRVECLDWAMSTMEPYGVYGGLSARQRLRLRSKAA